MTLFDGEMLIRILSRIPIQFFCEIIINFQIINENIMDPDDFFMKNS